MTPKDRNVAVRKAWYTVRSTLSESPAPANRDTSTLMPEKSDEMKTMTTRMICHLTPMAALPVHPTRCPTSAWSTMPCRPPTTLVSIDGQAIFHTAGCNGPSIIDRSYRGRSSIVAMESRADSYCRPSGRPSQQCFQSVHQHLHGHHHQQHPHEPFDGDEAALAEQSIEEGGAQQNRSPD